MEPSYSQPLSSNCHDVWPTPEPTASDPLNIDEVRRKLVLNNEMAITHLCFEALKHACDGITHTDERIRWAFKKLSDCNGQGAVKFKEQCKQIGHDIIVWMTNNPIKSFLMIVGLAITAYKAKTMAAFMERKAQGFIDWGQQTSAFFRFFGFVGLMTLRLVISTLVPPTSPGFGIILQAATPVSEKWTAMPFFLAASTIAGAAPYLLDKACQAFMGKDFVFTLLMKQFTSAWPLTCWTGPTMMKVFESAGGDKMGASLAVIVAHAAPFMGAQTTIMQRYFLPHPVDTIISQPFGMSEDLISMAMAEAKTNPALASASLSLLVPGFNLAQFASFSGYKDFKALATAVVNILVGSVVIYKILRAESSDVSGNAQKELVLVGFQLVLQTLVVPLILGCFLTSPPKHVHKATDQMYKEDRRLETSVVHRAIEHQDQHPDRPWHGDAGLLQKLGEMQSAADRIMYSFKLAKIAVQDTGQTFDSDDFVLQKLEEMQRSVDRTYDLTKT